MIARLFRFHGGIKPDYNKDCSTRDPIAAVPLPRRLVIPLHESIGATPRPLVKPGDRVLKGQQIGAPAGRISAAVHAPTSGTVKALEMHTAPHPSGLATLCVVIEPDGEERWVEHGPTDWRRSDPQTLMAVLREAGVVGLGGAVFPTHVKLMPGSGQVKTLVINGAECEPWITCDDMLMRERADEVTQGAAIMRHILGAQQVIIGVEDNKPHAIESLEGAAAVLDDRITVTPVPTLYPAGGEKQLLRVLTGIEVPAGRLPVEFGIQCFNVGTAARVFRALVLGEPLISRVITLTGNVAHPRNFEVPIGTEVDELLAMAGPLPDTNRYLMGGPMMGFTLPDIRVPVVKATNCVIAASDHLFPPPPPEMPCIRCGACAQVCPADLQPFELYWFSRSHNYGKAQEYHVFDCIECGCCAYVCPSRIRLVDYYRFAKSEIRAREADKTAADAARERHEFRQARLEREKQEKAERLAAKTAAGRAKAEAPPPAPAVQAAPDGASGHAPVAAETATADDAKKALIAAAIERARAKKEAAAPRNTEDLTPDQQAQIAEVEARRARIREMARARPEGSEPS